MLSAVESVPVFSEEEIQQMLDNLDSFSAQEQAEIFKIADILDKRRMAAACYDDLIEFCKHMQPDYKVGKHHRVLANLLMDIAAGRKDRVCVNMPPRHGKSQLVSIYFPAWFIGKYPNKKVLMVSHTADLAVDFGRKVRNLIDSDLYKEVFPTVTLAADSKSAGRWNTNHGGEYYACLRRYTLVRTDRGWVPAGQIKIGDRLANLSGYVTVQQVYESTHAETYTVAGTGLSCSAEHPIWTMNRGWVYAKDLLPKDILCVESILDRMKALFRRAYGYLEYPDVSPLVQHQKPLHQSPKRKMGVLRRARDYIVRTLVQLQKLCAGYGGSAQPSAYSGPNRCKWAIQPGKLSLGNTYGASKQQAQQYSVRRQDACGTRAQAGGNPRSDTLSDSNWGGSFVNNEKAQAELRAYRAPEKLGGFRSAIACVLARSGTSDKSKQPRCGVEGYLACVAGAAQRILGLLVGVRPAGVIVCAKHQSAAPFINFLTDGDHTFFADGVLTHNCGIGSALAGRGADLLLCDDPHNEQDIINGNFEVFEKAYEWFAYGARTRLMPGGRVAVIQTRWHQDDLSGRLTRDMVNNEGADQYEVVEFPAILEVEDADGQIIEKPLWPEFFDLEALHRTKASMPTFQWNAQFQQNPTAEEASIIKREWWNIWEKEDPPSPIEYIVMSLDAAAETHNRADYTAITIWGVFRNDQTNTYNIILLEAIKERIEFPDLKSLSYDTWKHWKPDTFIVEKKSSGTALYQELRRMGIPVSEYTPHRGSGDKLARLNSVADIVKSGLCWVPQTRWAEEVVEEIAGFPFMSHDDLVDSTVMALMRFRQGGFIRLPSDEPESVTPFKSKSRNRYY